MTKGAELSRPEGFVDLRDSAAASKSPVNPPGSRLWRLRPFLFLSLVIVSLSSLNAFAQSSGWSDSTLTAIKSLYDSGSYVSAELQARRVLEDKRVSDSLRIQLEKYLAFALVAQGKNESAVEHFINALRLDSSLTLDPVLTSPKILGVFETARRQLRLEVVGSKQVKPSTPANAVSISRGPTFRAILFPGWDQLYRGRKTKGTVLLALGGVAAVASVASDLVRRDARTKYLQATTPSLAESRYKTYNTYYKTEVYSISAFVIVYVYSEVDAFLDLPPRFAVDYSPSTRTTSLSFRLNF